MIGILDYGLGNVNAFLNIYNHLGISAGKISDPLDFQQATHLILPGVGSFDWAMTRLQNSGLRPSLDDFVLSQCKPILGICVGMQMMAESSQEGKLPGLGWIKGIVNRFDDSRSKSPLCLPHMGWNDVQTFTHPLFAQIHDQSFYFLHSYYFSPSEPQATIASTTYGLTFASSVGCASILGVQFHPEKSHQAGVQLLKNFSSISHA